MCNTNQANADLNNRCKLHTVDLAVDPTEGWLESMKAAVAVETAAEVAVETAVEVAAAAAVAAAAELAAVEGEKFLELARLRRWLWESFPSLPGRDLVAFHLI